MASTFSSSRVVENFGRRNHDAKIDDLVIVAGQDHADDVLADVMHVALDRRHQDFAGAGSLAVPFLRFSSSMKGSR